MAKYKKVRKAILPVAGLGTRFLPATKAMPKEMLTVVDKPLIQYAVEEALEAGIEEFIFITGRGKSAIENHFDKPYELADILRKKGKDAELESVLHIIPEHTRISYIRQGEPLGLGHAIWCARSVIGDEPFAVLLPDDIIHSTTLKDMVSSYEEQGKPAVMYEEVPLDRTHNYGILDIGDNKFNANGEVNINSFVEKPESEDAPSTCGIIGRYILTPRIFDFLAEKNIGAGGEIQLTDAMVSLCKEQVFRGFKLKGERFDCGDKVGFQKANLFFALKDPYIGPRLTSYIKDMQLTPKLVKTA